MRPMPLCDAVCQIQQAQVVLEMWLESTTKEETDLSRLIGSIITLLNGVPESVRKAEEEIGDYVMREHKESKQ